ncbi:MAG: VWA domain-containing protein [Acidobacteriota bacterium]
MIRLQQFTLASVLAASALGRAEVISTPSPEPVKATSSVAVSYVLVPFVVTNLKGLPVRNLREEDVTLLVDGTSVKTDLFARSDDAPVSFTILLDGSGSMGLAGKLAGARAAVVALVEQKIPGDDFALFVFAEGAVKEIVPFTEDSARVVEAVNGVKAFGKTAFFDALAKMPDKSLLGKNGSRAIILLTDGIDNASAISSDELAALLEGVDVPVYPIGLRSPGAPVFPAPGQSVEDLLNLEILGHVARITGGRLSIVDEPSRLPDSIRLIEKDLRAQYLLGFTAAGTGPVRFRRIALRLSGPVRAIRVRAGYKGPAPPAKG